MDIPRTYLTEIAVAALAKVGFTEPHQLMVEQAIVDLQGVQNLIARGATDLITTDFERACMEALSLNPLDQWLVRWRQAQKAEQDAVKAQAEAEEAAVLASRAEHVARAEARAAESEAAEAAAKAETAAPVTTSPPARRSRNKAANGAEGSTPPAE